MILQKAKREAEKIQKQVERRNQEKHCTAITKEENRSKWKL